jgi:hypothetical protein
LQNPIRDQIRMVDRWHVRPIDQQAASVFVPQSWLQKSVFLKSEKGESWTEARIGHTELAPQSGSSGTWLAGNVLQYGTWNNVEVRGGQLSGASLVAAATVHIAALEARAVSPRCLLVRVDLAVPPDPDHSWRLFFTVTAESGHNVGRLDLAIGHGTQSVSLEIHLDQALRRSYRLKVILCRDEHIMDNARITRSVED